MEWRLKVTGIPNSEDWERLSHSIVFTGCDAGRRRNLLRHMIKKTSSKRKKLPYLVLLHDGAIERPLIPNIVFSLASFTDANCELEFRFDIGGLQRLCVLLQVPVVVITAHRDRVMAIEALCIMLRRLAYPQRLDPAAASLATPRPSACLAPFLSSFTRNVKC
ncbi:hypothetical protein L917_09266 [Phytophthora nicotianae]|uniref:Centromere protein M n=1 Tax=Phytophthora nicotianae TaxID=4792 RepID=W2L4R5_PHYNI|nr:hypothetical protein L917_09266 [Phytophthora nicotianae]